MTEDERQYRTELPRPAHEMTPTEKGRLLLEYVTLGASVAGLDFTGAEVSDSYPAMIDWRTFYLLDYEIRESYGFLTDGSEPHAFSESCLDDAILDDVKFGHRDLSCASLKGASLLAVRPVQRLFGFAPWTKIPARGAAMGFTTGS